MRIPAVFVGRFVTYAPQFENLDNMVVVGNHFTFLLIVV